MRDVLVGAGLGFIGVVTGVVGNAFFIGRQARADRRQDDADRWRRSVEKRLRDLEERHVRDS